MDRVQRSGLIALAVLLLTALGAHYVGSLPGSDATVPPRLAAQNPGTLEGVKFLPPEQRQFFVGPADFVRPPVRNPMLGTQPRNIDANEPVNLESSIAKNEPTPARPKGSPNPGGEASKRAGALVPLTDDLTPPVADLPPRQPGRFIRVRENDNLTRIAKRELSDGSRWPEIASLNGIKAPYRVRFGQRLQMPGNGASPAREAGIPDRSNGGQAMAAGSNRNGQATPATGRLYTVGKDETASHIALRFLGSASDFQKILDHNGIKDPRHLAAGQVIRIPPR
jgi:hypothetical protein